MIHIKAWQVTVLVAALLGAVGAVAFMVAAMSEAPVRATADTYAELFENQQRRDDVRAAPTVEALATVAVVATTQEGESAPQPTATASPTAEAKLALAPVSGIRMPSIGVDARVVTLGILPSGFMDVPKSPELVGIYDFTGKPGLGGNAVLSGHVDYAGYGPAVFWDLRDLEAGDDIEIELIDGTVLTYRVTSALDAALAELDMASILAQTEKESLTLITCSGSFVGGGYTNRLVIRAVRIS